MSDLISPILYQLGTGGILGFIIGYAFKKVLKIIAVIVGIFAVILIYLGHSGIIYVNYPRLTEAVEGLLGNIGETSQWLTTIIASLPFAGSLIVGCALGFKKG